MNWITGSILILHGRTPKIVIQPFDGSWKCQAESALEALSDAAFWNSAISCTRRKVRAMQASLSIWSGAGFSTYRRFQDVGGQFTCYAKMILSHTMSMNPDDNGNLPPVTFRSHPWLA